MSPRVSGIPDLLTGKVEIVIMIPGAYTVDDQERGGSASTNDDLRRFSITLASQGIFSFHVQLCRETSCVWIPGEFCFDLTIATA